MQGLSKFGYEFQVKLITCLLTDINFNSRVFDILRPEYFDSEALNWLCDVILKYYQKYHSLATIPVLKYEIDGISDTKPTICLGGRASFVYANRVNGQRGNDHCH